MCKIINRSRAYKFFQFLAASKKMKLRMKSEYLRAISDTIFMSLCGVVDVER